MSSLNVSIRFEAAALNAAFGRLTAIYDGRALGSVLRLVSERLELLFELDYPAQSRAPLEKRYTWPNGTKSRFKSIRHQRAFFALLKAGRIVIPYRRRFALRKAVKVDARQTSKSRGDIRFSLDERQAPHASYVMGSPQTSYFANRTKWKEFKQAIQDQRKDVQDALNYAVETVVEDLL